MGTAENHGLTTESLSGDSLTGSYAAFFCFSSLGKGSLEKNSPEQGDTVGSKPDSAVGWPWQD